MPEVPAVTVTPDRPPQDINVYYRKTLSDQNVKDEYTGISSFTVTFTDGLGKTLKTQSVNAGASATAPADPKREGYTFDGWDKSFNSVNNNLTVNAKWKANKTEIVNDSKTVKRTISYYYADGKPVISTDGKPASEYYQWTFNRTGIKDTVTGKINWSDWSDKTTFPEKTVMAFAGYTPDRKSVPAQVVDHNSKSWEIKVYYTKNGSNKVKQFTGFSYEGGVWVYYKNGAVDTSLTGLRKASDKKWYYFVSGKQDKSYTGMAKSPKTGKWLYVKNGSIDYTYTGMAKSPKTGKWYYMKNGVLDTSYTGIAKSPKNGKWYYMRNGVLDKSFTGVCVSPKTGKLVYLKNGVLNNKFSGTVKIGKSTYRVNKGVAVLVK